MVGAALFVRRRGACEAERDEENNSRNPNMLDFFHRNFLSQVESPSLY
jgi:hypothetical protein